MNAIEKPAPDEKALRQVRHLSRPFLILLSIALGLIVLVQIPEIIAMLFFFHGGKWHGAVSCSASGINLFIFASPDHSTGVMVESLSFGQRSALALLAALCAVCGGMAIFHLRQLFALYSQGAVFAEDNILHIKRFGLWLAAAGVVVNGAGAVFFVITGQHPQGTANTATAVIFGGMIYVVAWVMDLGRQADEERKKVIRTLAEESAQRERMNREIEIARDVQQRLFPQNVPGIDGVSLAGRCRPASEVGGDYYDLMKLEDGKLGFAIGDVSGKGISAALIMASLCASLRGLVLNDSSNLAKMMQSVNRLLYEASTSSRYATFFFATFDAEIRELRYVNAGHNPPILVKGISGELQRLEACGPVVGLFPIVDYEEQSLILQPGDLLIAYTDGISEAMTANEEEWGEGRMLEAVPRCAGASASEVIENVFRAADEFTAGVEQHDDMTLLIMKLKKDVLH